MKAFKIGLLVFLITSMSFSCAKKKEMPFPKPEEVAGARPGELIRKTGTYEIKGKTFRADFGTIIVPENRKNPASRAIERKNYDIPALISAR